MRSAAARAATRRGCNMITCGCSRPSMPLATTAGGTRVVFPAPGGATTTTLRRSRTRRMISGTTKSIGSESIGSTSKVLPVPGRFRPQILLLDNRRQQASPYIAEERARTRRHVAHRWAI